VIAPTNPARSAGRSVVDVVVLTTDTNARIRELAKGSRSQHVGSRSRPRDHVVVVVALTRSTTISITANVVVMPAPIL